MVLPEPVPPEMRLFTRQRPTILRICAPSGVMVPNFDQLVERELVLFEFADGQCGPVNRQRRGDGVDTRAVMQTRVADRRGFIDAPANLADDALTDVEQLLVIAEADAGALNFAGNFDVNRA